MRDIYRQIEKLENRHEVLWGQVHKLEEGFDEFNQDLRALKEYVRQRGDVPLRSCLARVKAGQKALRVESALKSVARTGVRAVRIEIVGDRSAIVSIGGGSPFPLTETLWAMLEALCRNDLQEEGEFVRFKNWEEIASTMQKRLGKRLTRHAVHQTLCRLRAALCSNFDASAGASPFLIQTRKDVGARFLLRRDGDLVIRGEVS